MLFVTGPRFRRLLVLLLVGAIVVRVVRKLQGGPTRAFDQPAAPVRPTVDQERRPPAANWVSPADGACPAGHPVKANLRSGIFHLPGMSAYDRTNADRCYVDAESAAADALRVAKR